MTQKEQILRIRAMEVLFDDLLAAGEDRTLHPATDPLQAEKLRILLEYYEGPLWRRDYEADERGELPKTLKRGILSEDGFYDFFTEYAAHLAIDTESD